MIVGDGCWEWIATKDRHGYGRVGHLGKVVAVHRKMYEMFVGEIPEGMSVCHTCDNRWCVNPSHLWIGNNYENTLDKMRKGRHQAQRDSALPLKRYGML